MKALTGLTIIATIAVVFYVWSCSFNVGEAMENTITSRTESIQQYR